MCGCGPGCSAPAAARGLGVSPLRSAGDSAPGAVTKRAVHAGPRGPGRRDTRPWTHGLRTAGPWSLGRAAATSFTAPSRTAARVRGAWPVPGPRDAPLQLSLPRVGPPLSFQSPLDSLPEARSSDQPGSVTVASDEHPWSGAAPATPSPSLCHRKATRVALSVRKPVLATRPGCGR